MPRIVIALGGNALGNGPDEQRRKLGEAAPSLVDLIEQGNEIILTHGNGPQVGMINLAFEESARHTDKVDQMGLPECTAMSQGYIGYHLQQELGRELARRKLGWHVSTVVTQVEVDPDDSAFHNPTKPIGAFYDEEFARHAMVNEPGSVFVDDAGRGWRRVVPSPMPLDIVEKESILNLLDHGYIVIACGGGGIPVVRTSSGEYRGVDAVIDKDLAAARLAELVGADFLIILTTVDKVCVNWNKPEIREIDEMTVDEARLLMAEGHFAKGSMLPKIEAAIAFASSSPARMAIIASLGKASAALGGVGGTTIRL